MVAFKNVLVFVILTKITQINYRCCLVVQKTDGHFTGLKKEFFKKTGKRHEETKDLQYHQKKKKTKSSVTTQFSSLIVGGVLNHLSVILSVLTLITLILSVFPLLS